MKKPKMIAVALIIGIAMFIIKLLQRETVEIYQILLYSLGFGAFGFIGLLWITNFVLNKKAILFIFQGALMLFAQVFFLFLFFYTSFGRVYESALFFIVVSMFVFVNYVLFSMVNIFVVWTEKPLPLVNVAKSSSFIFSLATVYFGSFAVLNSNLPIYFIALIEFLLVFVVTIMYFVNLEVSRELIFKESALISYSVLGLFLAGMLFTEKIEFLAFLPVIAMFILNEKKFRVLSFIQAMLFFLILLLLAW